MSILESLELALKNIVSSKVRTLLTMLGIIIGVAAVIIILALGNGLTGMVRRERILLVARALMARRKDCP